MAKISSNFFFPLYRPNFSAAGAGCRLACSDLQAFSALFGRRAHTYSRLRKCVAFGFCFRVLVTQPVPLPSRCFVLHQLKSKVRNILTKTTALCINLNIDGAPIDSRAHSPIPPLDHSQTSRLLSTSLSLGTPFPHST